MKLAPTRQGQKDSVSPAGSVVRWAPATGGHRPSALGFGVAVGKILGCRVSRSVRTVAEECSLYSSVVDAILMLLSVETIQ